MIDDVVVGHSIAIGRNKESGTLAGDNLMALQHAVRQVPEAKLLEEFLHWRAGSERKIVITVLTHARHFCGNSSIFTRTEITAGFTLATRSAKLSGCVIVESAACAADTDAGRLIGTYPPGPAKSTVPPRMTVDANR